MFIHAEAFEATDPAGAAVTVYVYRGRAAPDCPLFRLYAGEVVERVGPGLFRVAATGRLLRAAGPGDPAAPK